MDVDIDHESSAPATSTLVTNSKVFVHQSTQTSTTTTKEETIRKLRRQVKSLKQKVQRRDIKISSMKDVIKQISQSGFSNENLDGVLKNYFEG